MNWDFAIDPIVYVLLASVRLLAMLQTAPVFREEGVPRRVRTALALIIAYMLAPAPGDTVDWKTWGGADLLLVVFVEITIGLLIGLAANLVFVGFSMMGDFISTQGGLSASRVLDPSSGVSSTALARTFNGFGMLVFLAIDGHHELIKVVAITFNEIPMGLGVPDIGSYLALVHSGSVMFETAVRLAAPITVAIFIQNVATGVLSKSLQQLNLMVVQLPAHIGILLVILGFGAGDFINAIQNMLEASLGRVMAVVLGAA